MLLKYVTTQETKTPEDLLTYAEDLTAVFNREGLDRVEVIAIPITPDTTVREVVKALTDLPLVKTLPPTEQVEFEASFKQVFHTLDPNQLVLKGRDPAVNLSLYFMFISTEKPVNPNLT